MAEEEAEDDIFQELFGVDNAAAFAEAAKAPDAPESSSPPPAPLETSPAGEALDPLRRLPKPAEKRALSEAEAVSVQLRTPYSEAACRAVARTRHGVHPALEAYTLEGVLTSEECAELISAAEALGLSFWDPRPSASRTFRDADTLEVARHEALAAELWRRVRFAVAVEGALEIASEDDRRGERATLGRWEPSGVNANLLLARYRSGGHFAPHTDGYSVEDLNTRSMLTAIVYLNDCAVGGGTRFYEDEQTSNLSLDDEGRLTGQNKFLLATVAPKAGRLLCFYHNHVHEGVPPGEGECKYILRTDLMYTRTPKICDSPADREAFALYCEAERLAGNQREKEALELFQRCFRLSPALKDLYGM